MITWKTENGEASGYLALSASKKGRGVLVLHAWWGLTEFIEGVCNRLADAGFVALAPDLFGNGATAETIAEAEQLIESEDYEQVQAIVRSAVQLMAGHPAVEGNSIGAVGFSFGAPYAMLAACDLAPSEVEAVVLFYGNHPGIEWEDFAKAEAAFLGHFAADDPYEDPDEIEHTLEKIKKAGKEAAFYVYPETGHWFFENNRPDAYDSEAAELAWERTLTFLQAHLN